jgi:polyisoprenoid-binding protein YceI
MKKFFAFAFVAFLVVSAQAQAAVQKYIYDPVHTQIFFSVDHLGFSHPSGRFTKFSGGFTFDNEKPEASVVEVVIETPSINMNDAAWDKHLKSADFFNVEKFPTMTFKSTKVEKTGEKTGKLTGDLTLLGVTKPVTLDVTYNKSGIHPYSKNYIAGFSATALLKRSDFGMVFALPVVGDDVTLNIQVEGIRQDFENLKK